MQRPAGKILIFTVLITIISAILVSGCAGPARQPVTENLLSAKDERALWQQAREEERRLEASGLVYDDQALEEYLNRVVTRLEPSDLPAGLTFRVRVIRNPFLNAFAYPNGRIYVHTGILARLDNEAQLAALLAHEMVHCIRRHALQSLRDRGRSATLAAGLENALSDVNGLRQLARFLGLAASAATAGYHRQLEAEADTGALELMAAAGYDPQEALQLLAHLEQERDQEQIHEPFFYGNHPRLDQRLKTLENLLATRYKHQDGKIRNARDFRRALADLLLENVRLDLRLGRFETARRGVEKYLRMRPTDARAFCLLGEIFRQRDRAGDAQMALDAYRRALQLNPASAAAHRGMGLIRYKQGQPELARRHFETCLALSPDIEDRDYIRGYLKKCPPNSGS